MNYLESLELTEESDYFRLTALLDNEKQAVLKTELNLKSNENFNKRIEDTQENIWIIKCLFRATFLAYGSSQARG